MHCADRAQCMSYPSYSRGLQKKNAFVSRMEQRRPRRWEQGGILGGHERGARSMYHRRPVQNAATAATTRRTSSRGDETGARHYPRRACSAACRSSSVSLPDASALSNLATATAMAPDTSAVRCYRPTSEAFCELSPARPLLFPISAECVAVEAEPHPASSLSRASEIFAFHGRGWTFLACLSHRRQNTSPVYLLCWSVFCLCTVTTVS
jgi:hypothetical protein